MDHRRRINSGVGWCDSFTNLGQGGPAAVGRVEIHASGIRGPRAWAPLRVLPRIAKRKDPASKSAGSIPIPRDGDNPSVRLAKESLSTPARTFPRSRSGCIARTSHTLGTHIEAPGRRCPPGLSWRPPRPPLEMVAARACARRCGGWVLVRLRTQRPRRYRCCRDVGRGAGARRHLRDTQQAMGRRR